MRSLWEFLKSFKRAKNSSDHGQEIVAKGSRPKERTVTSVGVNDRKAPGPLIRKRKEKVHIQIGLDFGTSSTKAIYSHIGRRISRVICFNHNLPNYPPYCLPSLAAIDPKGQLLLGADAATFLAGQEWDSGLQRLKVIVAGNHDKAFTDSVTQENFQRYLDEHDCADRVIADDLAALFLAHAMHECRKLIQKSSDYRGIELDIAFNICVPIDHIQNNVVNEAFQKIFIKAERIESAWRTSTKKIDFWSLLQEEGETLKNPEKRVFAVPESVAAMASYLVSLRKRPGRHAIIDFGAGTTDVSICNLLFQGVQSTSYWYSARNIPKGTIGVERVVAKYISECSETSSCSCFEVSDFLDRLGEENVQISENTKKVKDLYGSIQGEIRCIRESKIYAEAWGKAYAKLRKQGAWENVEIFMTGGGAQLPFAKELFSEPWWKNLDVRYPVSALPEPDDYHPGDCVAPFNRMSVAYGLARPTPELEEYVLPEDVVDQTPPLPPVKNGPDRDELYPK